MSDERQLFLLGQKLFRLKPDVPPDERKSHVCDAGFDEKAWEAELRFGGFKWPGRPRRSRFEY
jgi:hypothetical protein